MFERSLQVLLHEIVDYAGLFPPAQLALDPAIRNYARYRGEPNAWMLGRFICPVAKLAALEPYADELFAARPPFRFSVLARGGDTAAAFADNLHKDVEDLRGFTARNGGNVGVDALEVKLPIDVCNAASSEDVLSICRQTAAALAAIDGRLRPVFFEPQYTGEAGRLTTAGSERLPPTSGPETRPTTPGGVGRLTAAGAEGRLTTAVAEGLQRFNAGQAGDAPRFGFKLRTGGLEAAAFPSPAQVAEVIATCVGMGVPMKFTAGLHHPIRRYDAGVRANMHGFINVFAAAVLARSQGLGRYELAAILEETDPASFAFRATHLAWNQADATLGDIEFARQHVALSFGSCSFDEPIDDLRALGWM